MIRIAICDDEIQVCRSAERFVRQMAEEDGLQVDILQFHNGTQLVKEYPHPVDVLLLDIELGDWNGLELAKELRKKDTKVQIVFITNMPQFAVGGYKVQAFGYLLKPVSYEEFALELRELIKALAGSKDASISFRTSGETLHLPVSEICYAETYGRKLLVHGLDRSWEVSGTMGVLEKELEPHGFVRCHTAYLVNAQKIRRISGNELIMADGEHLPISKHRRAKCIQQLNINWGRDS